MYDAATLWDYADYAFCSFNAMKEMAVNYEDGNKLTEAHFFVEDAAQLDNVIAEVQNISSINWDHFIISANDEVYQNISSALSDTKYFGNNAYCSHYGSEYGTDHADSLHVHPQPKERNRHPDGSGDCQACGDSPVCAGNAADCRAGFPSGLCMQSAGGRYFGNAVWKGIRERNRSAGAFSVGYCRGADSADYSSSDIQHLGYAAETKADLIPDGIKETRYEPQNEFRNTGGFTYRPKMEKRRCCFSACFSLLRLWCCRGWRLQMHRRSSRKNCGA